MTNSKVTAWENKTEKFLVALALIFIAILIIPFAHPISDQTKLIFQVIDYVIWTIFAIDYFYKLTIADSKRIFLRSHVLELLIVAIPALRPLRLLRIFPVVGYFLNYSQKNLAGKLVQYVTLVAVFISIPAAIYTFQIERNAPGANIKTFGDAIWWTITTVFTVGYGDRYPVTVMGRVMATLVMLAGISLVGVITASIASWFVRSDEEVSEKIELQTIMTELNEIKLRIEKLEK